MNPMSVAAEELITDGADSVESLIVWLRAYAKQQLDIVRMNALRHLPPELINDLGNHGVLGALAPREMGGLGLSQGDTLRLIEQIAAIDIGVAAFVVLHYASSVTYDVWARPSLRNRLLPELARGRSLAALALTEPVAGSNLRAIETRARRLPSGHYRIDGQKTWISNAEWATTLTCLCRDDDGGLTAFVVPAHSPGVTIEPRLETLGLHSTVHNPITFSAVEVGEQHLLGKTGGGLSVTETALTFGRLATGAIALGAMRRCAQIMGRFAERRRVSTGLLIDNAVTQERLCEAHGAIVALNTLINTLVDARTAGRDLPAEAYMAVKVSGSELLFQTIDSTLQLLGSRGYAETNGIAGMFRDARFLRIGEGPTETLRVQIGAAIAHHEARMCEFLRELGGREVELRLAALGDEHARSGARMNERHYERLGRVACWELLDAALSHRRVGDPTARSFIRARLSEAHRALRDGSDAAFDLAAWQSALAVHNEAIGSLDESWPIPQATRDPFLQRDFRQHDGAGRPASTASLSVLRPSVVVTGPQPHFLFRAGLPTDGNQRELGIPRTWRPHGQLGPSIVVAAAELAQVNGSDFASIILAVLIAFVARFSGETEIEVLRARIAGHRVPCGGVSADLTRETSISSLLRPLSHPVVEEWSTPAEAIRSRSDDGSGSRKPVLGGISVAFVYNEGGAVAGDDFEGVDLTLVCERCGSEVELYWMYDGNLFSSETIERRHANFEIFLLAALAHPRRDYRHIALMPAEERKLVLDGFNGPVTDPSYYRHTVHSLVEAQADRTPDAIAIETPSLVVTYRQLEEQANRLAQCLRARGLRDGEMVAIATGRSPAMVVGLLGALKAGGRFVILNCNHPAERRIRILKETEAKIVVVDPCTRAEVSSTTGSATVVIVDGDGGDPRHFAACRPSTATTPDDIAYVMFTSGSTGQPKGAEIPHRAISNQMLARRDELGLCPGDRVLQTAAPNFDIAIWELVGPLIFGARVVLSGEREITLDAARIARLIDQHSITAIQIVPSQLVLLLEQLGPRTGNTLRHVICGGESLAKPLQQRFFESAAQNLYNFYGPTEGVIDTTWWRCRPDDPSPSAPIGCATTNRRVYVLDERAQPQPFGVPGELYIGGVGLATGYLADSNLSAERFIDDPFSAEPGAKMYRTGDRVRYRSDGVLEFLGRLDRQIKIRGVRIEPGEIEAVLCRHAQVAACAVTVRPTPTGDKRLVAYLQLRDPRQVPAQRELRAFALEVLPAEMVPNMFVALDALPHTSTGKVDIKALPPVDWSALDTSDTGTAGMTEQERALAAIWSEILAVHVNDAKADFFELGGHSLLAVRVLSRIRDVYGAEISISEFFEASALDQLATRVAAACSGVDQAHEYARVAS